MALQNQSDQKAFIDSLADDALVGMARCAEAAERYDDMCKFMKKLVITRKNSGQKLDTEERNLLSVAYKNVIGARRASWRILQNELNGDVNPPVECPSNLSGYKAQVETEIESICSDIIELLQTNLINDSGTEESEEQVFFLKMAGDYYRYLAESLEKEVHCQKTAEYYQKAFEMGEKTLAPTHPIRLGLALNYSVCHYEILKSKDAACTLAKEAFDQAILELDSLREEDYKDSTLIMQLLRDNLTLWTSNDELEDNQDQ
jgi:hypothetical protein